MLRKAFYQKLTTNSYLCHKSCVLQTQIPQWQLCGRKPSTCYETWARNCGQMGNITETENEGCGKHWLVTYYYITPATIRWSNPWWHFDSRETLKPSAIVMLIHTFQTLIFLMLPNLKMFASLMLQSHFLVVVSSTVKNCTVCKLVEKILVFSKKMY